MSDIESPVIALPVKAETRLFLSDKMSEYNKRFARDRHNLDALYKFLLLWELFQKGRVKTHDLCRQINTTYGFIIADTFNNACGVIEDYCKTGGDNCFNGTGLPVAKQVSLS